MITTRNDGTTYDDQTGDIYTFNGHTGYMKTGQKLPGFETKQPGGIASKIEQLGSSRTAMTDPQKLTDKVFGQTPQDYQGTFNEAYTNLGQPTEGHGNVSIAGTEALADVFADRVFARTGRLPTEDQVRQFVAQTLNSGFASKFITGINKDQILSNYVEPYLESSDILAPSQGDTAGGVENRILGLNDQIEKFYEAARTRLGQNVEDEYGRAKSGVANDLAGQGLLTQPTSRYVLNDLEAAKQKSLGQGLTELAGQEAGGNVDLGKTIESLLATERRAGESSDQFRKDFGLRTRAFTAGREDKSFDQGLQRQQLSLAEQLGKMQAEAQKPGFLDYLNAGTKLVSSVADPLALYKGLKGKGA